MGVVAGLSSEGGSARGGATGESDALHRLSEVGWGGAERRSKRKSERKDERDHSNAKRRRKGMKAKKRCRESKATKKARGRISEGKGKKGSRVASKSKPAEGRWNDHWLKPSELKLDLNFQHPLPDPSRRKLASTSGS